MSDNTRQGLTEAQERVLGAVNQHMVWYDGRRLRPVAGLPSIHSATEGVLFDHGYIKAVREAVLLTDEGREALSGCPSREKAK